MSENASEGVSSTARAYLASLTTLAALPPSACRVNELAGWLAHRPTLNQGRLFESDVALLEGPSTIDRQTDTEQNRRMDLSTRSRRATVAVYAAKDFPFLAQSDVARVVAVNVALEKTMLHL